MILWLPKGRRNVVVEEVDLQVRVCDPEIINPSEIFLPGSTENDLGLVIHLDQIIKRSRQEAED
jgi:hypothetical protein